MVALVLAAGLAGPALAAPGSPKAAPEPGGWWKAAASWLAGAWSGLEDAAAVVTRGLSMDPNGGTSTSESDRGASVDPNG
ncbi:MAG TPA: hypothetical protein VKM72_04995 [Thermoanaerobaculia bacterium]|nr:hypothetical protein [Thermoanaerobaculia bacterium]